MKKYILIIQIIAFLTLFNSCNEDVLDIPQQGVLSVDETYANADDDFVVTFIASVYTAVYGKHYDFMGWTNYGTGIYSIWSNLNQMAGESRSAEYQWDFTASSETGTFEIWWSYYYGVIYQCNQIIERLPENTVATESVKNRVIAEARAIRSIMMMYLVQLWGNPPLADHVMNGTEGNTPASESWAFIESELAAAAEVLPSKDGSDGQAAIGGRLTKEAVYAYLGKAYLWQGDYSEAATTLHDKVIATGLYALVPEFDSLNSYSADFSEEYLWEFEVTNIATYSTSQSGYFVPISMNWYTGYVNYPDGFYYKNGWGHAAYPTESFGSFMDNHDRLADDSESKRYMGTLIPYEDLLDSSRFTYTRTGGEKGLLQAQWGCEGYFRKRKITLTKNITGPGSSYWADINHNNPCFMRYAEVLLNYAEAVAMGGTQGAYTGLQALNEVRQRAGLSDAPALDMDNENYGIKAERRAELYFEGCRFIDLVRWDDAATELADFGKTEYTFFGYEDGNNDVLQSKANWSIETATTIGEGFKENKNELFPIPLVELNNNANLEQNTGW